MLKDASFRAQLIMRTKYNRPLNDEGTIFETWEQTVDRVIQHQRKLWEDQLGHPLNEAQFAELEALSELILSRKVSLSGRTLWLGGTAVGYARAASQFNCSFKIVSNVYDVVDCFWLLLQGCGVGALPMEGTLSGFAKRVKIETIRSTRTERGYEHNRERFYERDGQRVWELIIGDSAEAWAKSIGKILAMKRPVDVIVLNFSEIRPAGTRLKGYGWISSGDELLHDAYVRICKLMNKWCDSLLPFMAHVDLLNLLGTVLSSRRSAEILLCGAAHPDVLQFMSAKKNFWQPVNEDGDTNHHRQQSNNSVVFYDKPSLMELRGLFWTMQEGGGSEPGIINGKEAKRRAPWFKGVNPCAEILLSSSGFCNLVEVDLGKFIGDTEGLLEALHLVARANYRQTCVDLHDGILSDSWHETNEYLRLCGVGLTGVVKWLDNHCESYVIAQVAGSLHQLRDVAKRGAHSMADELGLPRPKAITTIKPSGTLGKMMDTTEGVHRPLGKYIFNNQKFGKHDPVVPALLEAGYRVVKETSDSLIITIPYAYEDVKFDEVVTDDGRVLEVNKETALEQLERYRLMMSYYVDHNCSVTISYDPSEVEDIVNWLYDNWDNYVGVSFLYRTDPTFGSEQAAKLGYEYLPQEVVTREAYEEYVATLKPVDLSTASSLVEDDADCASGACPIR